jgi:hypothetical protein
MEHTTDNMVRAYTFTLEWMARGGMKIRAPWRWYHKFFTAKRIPIKPLTAEQIVELRQILEDMTAEQIVELRQILEDMSPEKREDRFNRWLKNDIFRTVLTMIEAGREKNLQNIIDSPKVGSHD